jgi:hypothetical protein
MITNFKINTNIMALQLLSLLGLPAIAKGISNILNPEEKKIQSQIEKVDKEDFLYSMADVPGYIKVRVQDLDYNDKSNFEDYGLDLYNGYGYFPDFSLSIEQYEENQPKFIEMLNIEADRRNRIKPKNIDGKRGRLKNYTR